MNWFARTVILTTLLSPLALLFAQTPPARPLSVTPSPIAGDKTVRYDFPIVYVRAPRKGDYILSKWADVFDPRTMEPGADLVLLHPDGKEEVLVPVSAHESIADPQVSFDGEWVYYAKLYDARKYKGSDIFKVHVPTRKIVRLTNSHFTPNTGVASWSRSPMPDWGSYNLGPCPVPGGKVAFVSDRNAFQATNTAYTPRALALQLHLMDEDGGNVECIGHFNLGSALHPVILQDGRILFSSLESEGLRSHHLWGAWAVHPDGTQWNPLFSAFEIGNSTADSTHFQTQLSDGSVVVESYYLLNNLGFGTYYKFPIRPAEDYPAFGPAYKNDPRNAGLRHGWGRIVRIPFSPIGVEALTPFVPKGDVPSETSVRGDKNAPRLGKFTHPSAAPDNHLLTVWSPGSITSSVKLKSPVDAGLYLIKSGKPIDEPGQMLLIKNDPKYHEQWPRALVPYKRIHGIAEPRRLVPLANDGKRSKHLPEGTPFGLVGTSSLYKRETYPYGIVPPGSVTSTFAGKDDPTGHRGHDTSFNWTVQGADAGLYDNADIHAIRILALEPTTENGGRTGRRYFNHAHERMRILGEFPVRKFTQGDQPLDPDGNPDTSFLAKLPADVAWTFQTLDKHGMVLNMAQTWHQLRPGEIRTDCGGCHAHSQKPTLFEKTAAAKPDYPVFDLTTTTPLLTTRAQDASGKKWDVKNETGLRYDKGVKNVEYFRDVKPILDRSCVACHTQKAAQPAGNLILDEDRLVPAENPAGPLYPITVPGTYARLAADPKGKYGHKPLQRLGGWRDQLNASRYVKLMQARRSLLVWKLYGQRMDGWQNDDFPHEAVPGDPKSLRHKGQPVPDTRENRDRSQVAYLGTAMPPPTAIAGSYVGPDGKKIKVPALTEEERRTIVRWIDLGCPIDLDANAGRSDKRGIGWLLDDGRPTVTVTHPQAGRNEELRRIRIGMHDYYTGLDLKTFEVKADFVIDGVAAGENLAARFQPVAQGVWEYVLARPITALRQGTLIVSIKDREWNTTRVERAIRVGR